MRPPKRLPLNRTPRSAFLPTSRADMDDRGWNELDVLFITGDAYIDHPSFGVALLGRLLEQQGWRVGIVAQPDWHSANDFLKMGRPRLFAAVTAGAMDSMVSNYTSGKRFRHRDMYSPGGEGGKRPDRAILSYCSRAREALPGLPVLIGGVEASLRRFAHYDFWSDKLRGSWLLDSKADLLVYGNGEGILPIVTQRIHDWAAEYAADSQSGGRDAKTARRALNQALDGIRGTCIAKAATLDPAEKWRDLPSWEAVTSSKEAFMQAANIIEKEANPLNAPLLRQTFAQRAVWCYPPPPTMSTAQLDAAHELPYTRMPHPDYERLGGIPAYDIIKHSMAATRGCFGGCTFCAITLHQGRKVTSRSKESLLRELEQVKSMPDFKGTISDVGGPSANMYRMACKKPEVEAICKRTSCIDPTICKLLDTDHSAQIDLLKTFRETEGIKHVHVASGVRYDLALESPEYIKELAAHYTGGQLSVAPESTDPKVLRLMKKPTIEAYQGFMKQFKKASKDAGKEQYLIPYFISSHPGSSHESMEQQARWLKREGYRLQQVQDFLPTPMTLATAMYWSGLGPDLKPIPVMRGERDRRIQKSLLRWQDEDNREFLRKARPRFRV